jgi:hypothetical protein
MKALSEIKLAVSGLGYVGLPLVARVLQRESFKMGIEPFEFPVLRDAAAEPQHLQLHLVEENVVPQNETAPPWADVDRDEPGRKNLITSAPSLQKAGYTAQRAVSSRENFRPRDTASEVLKSP